MLLAQGLARRTARCFAPLSMTAWTSLTSAHVTSYLQTSGDNLPGGNNNNGRSEIRMTAWTSLTSAHVTSYLQTSGDNLPGGNNNNGRSEMGETLASRYAHCLVRREPEGGQVGRNVGEGQHLWLEPDAQNVAHEGAALLDTPPGLRVLLLECLA